jgi:hypothetical protein
VCTCTEGVPYEAHLHTRSMPQLAPERQHLCRPAQRNTVPYYFLLRNLTGSLDLQSGYVECVYEGISMRPVAVHSIVFNRASVLLPIPPDWNSVLTAPNSVFMQVATCCAGLCGYVAEGFTKRMNNPIAFNGITAERHHPARPMVSAGHEV